MRSSVREIVVPLAVVLLCGVALGAKNDMRQDAGHQHPASVSRPFKLGAAGQIDITTGSIEFGGVATHVGRYTASGFLNPADFSIIGTLEAANGDTLDFVAAFAIGPIGEIEATFTVTGGTGRFAGASGTASGPVALDPDFSFLIRAIGELAY